MLSLPFHHFSPSALPQIVVFLKSCAVVITGRRVPDLGQRLRSPLRLRCCPCTVPAVPACSLVQTRASQFRPFCTTRTACGTNARHSVLSILYHSRRQVAEPAGSVSESPTDISPSWYHQTPRVSTCSRTWYKITTISVHKLLYCKSRVTLFSTAQRPYRRVLAPRAQMLKPHALVQTVR